MNISLNWLSTHLDLAGKSIKEIDDTFRRIEGYPDPEFRDCLREEGERIKEAIAKFGVAPASYLSVIGKT